MGREKKYETALDWQSDAACFGADVEFVANKETQQAIRLAKKICDICEVKPECLNYALENNEEFGVWGGLSSQERRTLKRRRQYNDYNMRSA